MQALRAIGALVVAFQWAASAVPGAEGGAVTFVAHRIGRYRGEACGVGDFNNDGKCDIVALPYVYHAPDWKARKVCDVKGEVDEKGRGYRWDFMNAPLDVNGDGHLDVVTCCWFGQKSEWLENPGPKGGPWKRHLIEKRHVEDPPAGAGAREGEQGRPHRADPRLRRGRRRAQ